jgi:hypothetical protein
MDATQPFSLTMSQQRAGTNGFTTPEAYSEFIDDAYDAGSACFYAAAVRVPDSTKGFLVTWDFGSGARDIRVLYGIGPNVCRKTGEGQRGLKNYGHIAAMGYFNPDRVTHVSRAAAAARAGTLVFDLGALYAAVDAAGAGVNYRQIDTTALPALLRDYSDCGLTDEVRERLQTVIAAATPTEALAPLCEHLGCILRNEVPSFMLTIMEYDNFPTMRISEIVDAHRNYRMEYYSALTTGGHSIVLMSDKADECIIANAENAIDPMGPEDWPRLTGIFETRTTGQVTCIKITLTHDANTAVFWLAHVKDLQPTFYDGRSPRGPVLIKDEPSGWVTATPIGNSIDFVFSVISRAEEDRQKDRVGSSTYKSVEAMRGIRQRYHDRDLGTPSYNHSNWMDRRNIGGLRGILTFRDTETAESLIGIKTKKHSSNFEGLHQGLQSALNWIVGRIIIPHFSNYKVCNPAGGKGKSPGVTDWKFPWFCALMLNTKASLSVAPAPAPAPALAVADAYSDAESDDDTVTTASSSSGSVIVHVHPPPAKTPVAASLRTSAMSMRDFVSRIAIDLMHIANDGNLDELSTTASTMAVAGLSPLYNKWIEICATLEAAGLTYT